MVASCSRLKKVVHRKEWNMNYYDDIKNELLNNEINKKVKNYSINKSDLKTYYNVGKMISEDGKHYGENIIKQHSERLKSEVHKKYNTTLLKRIRQFYWLIEKGATLSHQLSWSHYVELLPIKNIDEINYYINQICINNIDIRTLRTIVKSREYKRLDKETRLKLINKEESNVVDFVKNPILIKNSYNYDNISEKLLQKLILDDITSFMKELGSGFSFIDNEFKIKVGDSYNYIDLLLYNIKFKCYVVIELKVIKLNSNHTGQIQNYMNYIDKNVKGIDDNKTVGIIICKQNNQYVIDYCSDDRIIAREYELV